MNYKLQPQQKGFLIFLINEYYDYQDSDVRDSILSKKGVRFAADIVNHSVYEEEDKASLNHLLELYNDAYPDMVL